MSGAKAIRSTDTAVCDGRGVRRTERPSRVLTRELTRSSRIDASRVAASECSQRTNDRTW